jgi:hypothetical protein
MIPSNSQIIKQWTNGCRDKISFRDLEYGKLRLAHFSQKYNKSFSLYRCPSCGKYHLTSKGS